MKTEVKEELGEFLSGPVVENLPSNTGDMGSISGQGTKIPQAEEQLSPGATELRSPCTAKREACTLPLRSIIFVALIDFIPDDAIYVNYFPFGHVFSGIF